MDKIKQRIKDTILEALMLDSLDNDFGDNDNLSEKLGIDSVGFLEILTALEEEFDISFEDENISRQTVGTIQDLENLIKKHL